RHRAAVYRAAQAAVGSASEAEDVAQETFLAAYRKMATYRAEASFKTWLLTIAWRRALARRRRLASLWRRLVSADPPEPASPEHSRTQERVLIEAERARHVMRLVRALPARLRGRALARRDAPPRRAPLRVVALAAAAVILIALAVVVGRHGRSVPVPPAVATARHPQAAPANSPSAPVIPHSPAPVVRPRP